MTTQFLEILMISNSLYIDKEVRHLVLYLFHSVPAD